MRTHLRDVTEKFLADELRKRDPRTMTESQSVAFLQSVLAGGAIEDCYKPITLWIYRKILARATHESAEVEVVRRPVEEKDPPRSKAEQIVATWDVLLPGWDDDSAVALDAGKILATCDVYGRDYLIDRVTKNRSIVPDPARLVGALLSYARQGSINTRVMSRTSRRSVRELGTYLRLLQKHDATPSEKAISRQIRDGGIHSLTDAERNVLLSSGAWLTTETRR